MVNSQHKALTQRPGELQKAVLFVTPWFWSGDFIKPTSFTGRWSNIYLYLYSAIYPKLTEKQEYATQVTKSF